MSDRPPHATGARLRAYTATVTNGARTRVMVPVPFDPDEAWGRKSRHHVHGTVNGMGVRAAIEPLADGRGFVLGAAWRRDCGIAAVVALLERGVKERQQP